MVSVTPALRESASNILSTAAGFEGLLRSYLKKLQSNWSLRYPDEPGVSSPEYMHAEFERTTNGCGPWLINQFRNRSVIHNAVVKEPPPNSESPSTSVGRCYYNALSFVKKNGTSYGELAFVMFIDPKSLARAASWITSSGAARPTAFDSLDHCLIANRGNGFLDPTLGDECNGEIAVPLIIPESVWEEFPYTENDPNQDARSLRDWISSRVKSSYSADEFVEWYSNAR